MLPEIELESGERLEIQLVPPADFARHPAQVAGITDRRIVFIKRKEFSRHPYAIEYFPLDSWSALKYRSRLALGATIFGAIVCFFGFLTIYLLWSGGMDALSYSIGLTMIAMGGTLALGPRRHHLRFSVRDKELKWRSAPMKYREIRPAVFEVLELARSRNLPVDGDLPTDRTKPPPYLQGYDG